MMERGGRYFGRACRVLAAPPDEARAQIDAILEAHEELERVMPDNHNPLLRASTAACLVRAGMLDRAGRFLDLAQEMQSRTGEVWTEPEILRVRARLYEAQGRPRLARETREAGWRRAVNAGAATLALRIACDIAEADPGPASDQLLEEAAARMRTLDDGWDARRLRGLASRRAG